MSARADEGGVPFWLSGSYSSFAAVPQQPGWYMPTQLYYYNGDASGTKSFQRGDSVNLGLSSKLAMLFLTPTWVPDEKWFGGQPSFALTFGGGWNSTSAGLSASTVNAGTQTLNRSDSDSGGSDLYPQAQIAWNSGNNNWMAYITGDMPDLQSYHLELMDHSLCTLSPTKVRSATLGTNAGSSQTANTRQTGRVKTIPRPPTQGIGRA